VQTDPIILSLGTVGASSEIFSQANLCNLLVGPLSDLCSALIILFFLIHFLFVKRVNRWPQDCKRLDGRQTHKTAALRALASR
jgi:hypothetical protein